MDAIEGFYCISIRAIGVFKLCSSIGALVLFSRSEFDHFTTDIKGPIVRFLYLIF